MNVCHSLQMTNDGEQAVGPRISGLGEHPHQAFRGSAYVVGQLLESDGRIDVVAQQSFSRRDVTFHHQADGLGKQRLAECRVSIDTRLDCLFEFSRKSHFLLLTYGLYGHAIVPSRLRCPCLDVSSYRRPRVE